MEKNLTVAWTFFFFFASFFFFFGSNMGMLRHFCDFCEFHILSLLSKEFRIQ